MMILLCFNNMGAKKFYSWTELLELLNVGENTLFDHLNGLCFPLKKGLKLSSRSILITPFFLQLKLANHLTSIVSSKRVHFTEMLSLQKKTAPQGTDMVSKDKDGKDVVCKFMINNSFTFDKKLVPILYSTNYALFLKV